jgi:hypothetical protein
VVGAAVLVAGVVSAAGAAGTATGATAPAVARPAFAKLSPAEVRARSVGRSERVVVVLSDGLTALPADRAHVRSRLATAASIQAPLLAQLRQVHATGVTPLSLIDAVAARIPSAEVTALRSQPGVAKVVPDGNIVVGTTTSTSGLVPASQVARRSVPAVASDGQRFCPTSPADPLLEPEALTNIHDASNNPDATDEGTEVATGKGVVVAILDADFAAGNPNMIRPDHQHVIIDAPNENENQFTDEFNGDVSTVAAQGTVVSSYGQQLPASNLPGDCTFRIVGDAPGVSIVDEGNYFAASQPNGTQTLRESQIIAGLDKAVETEHANVVSESYGYGAIPGASDDLLAPTNDAMVAAGVTVVESAGDSGSSGTVEVPADDPKVIDVGGTNDLRLLAQAYGYTKGWEDNNMTTLSSGGVAPNGRTVDLVAPGYVSLALAGKGNMPPLPTEAFGGTSQSAPFVAGAAADVIQAYSDTHGGVKPSPALVKRILTGTAQDTGAAADQQGAGLVDVYAAVEAARQMPGTTAGVSPQAGLVPEPSQLDVSGAPGTNVAASVKLYNASSKAVTVSGAYRSLGAETATGPNVTENVSAPAAGAAIPEQGATAAAPVHFTVPAGAAQLDADMRWPDATNNAILAFILTDPAGRLAQISYDYGGAYGTGASPDIQHTSVQHPMAGKWTAQIVWSDGRGHVQTPPETPGSYTGSVTFRASTQDDITSAASGSVTIPARSTKAIPLHVAMAATPGDTAESVQFTGTGVESSLPVAVRTLIPSSGGSFTATLTSSVSRGTGQIKTFDVDVPKGEKDLDVYLHAPDHAANDPVYYYAFSPSGLVRPTQGFLAFPSAIDATPTPDGSTGDAVLIARNPAAGLWEIDVEQGATTSGTTFAQAVTGTLSYDQVKPPTETGLPTSTSTVIEPGATRAVSVAVVNTTGRAAYFKLLPKLGDINGGAVTTPVLLPAGATGTLTATLSPKAAGGSTVLGRMSVVTSSDFSVRDANFSTIGLYSSIANYTYSYTVGKGSNT